MSWIPVFKIGIWNAWIPMLFVVLRPVIMRVVDRVWGSGNIYEKMGGNPAEDATKKSIPIPNLLLIALFIVSIFVPLKTGSLWLVLGLVIFVIGAAVFFSAIITAARTPAGKIFSGGMYRSSRHPLYLSFILLFLGISVACASWLFLLLTMAWMAFPLSQVNEEERGCLEVFGEEYREYMLKTPKWLGLPKGGGGGFSSR